MKSFTISLLTISALLLGCQKEIQIKREYKNGLLVKKYQINRNGKKNGVCKTFYLSGQDSTVTHFADGKKDGIEVTYYPNGKTKYIRQYNDGKLNQKTIIFRKNGELNQIATYKNGKFNGINYLFHKNKMLEKIYFGKDTITEGSQYVYYKNGALARYYFIKEGALGFQQHYDSCGNMVLREGSVIGVIEGLNSHVLDSLKFTFVLPPGSSNKVEILEYNQNTTDTTVSASNIPEMSYLIQDTTKNVKLNVELTDLETGKTMNDFFKLTRNPLRLEETKANYSKPRKQFLKKQKE